MLDLDDSLIKIGLSVLVGSIIGAEREYKSKNAGFRTMILVTFGATLFTMISEVVTHGKDYHVIGNIVVGIGFLGAGAIYKEGTTISGLTTAVTIWVAAALGMAVGCGEFLIAIISVFVVVAILIGFSYIQFLIDKKHREANYIITVKNENGSNAVVKELLQKAGLEADFVKIHFNKKNISFTIIAYGSDEKHKHLIALLSSSEYIESFIG